MVLLGRRSVRQLSVSLYCGQVVPVGTRNVRRSKFVLELKQIAAESEQPV